VKKVSVAIIYHNHVNIVKIHNLLGILATLHFNAGGLHRDLCHIAGLTGSYVILCQVSDFCISVLRAV
jgi:hypothetical protein